MKLLLVVAFLVTLPEGLLVSSMEMDVRNAAIEIFNDCNCVPWYRCDENGRIISGNSSPKGLSARINVEISKIECLSNLTEKYYCCKTGNVNTKAGVGEVECGVGRTLMVPRIFNDEDDSSSSDGEFPWMAAIFLKKKLDNYSLKCGGSLIHPQVVLTANHCIFKKHANNLMVVVNGKTEVSLSEEEGKRSVSEIVRHPKYRHTGKLYYDAALLILEQPLVVGEDAEVNTICLPPAGVDMGDMQCLVAGWGRDKSKRREEDLRKIELPFVNHSQCDVLLKNSRLGWRFNLHESFMCAGGEEGKDACVGDGGGPLMCPMPKEDNRYFQAGIVSWGIGCGLKNVPGVYTDVRVISEWIKTELKNRNIILC